MRQKIYDILRVPYYKALIVKHGEVIGSKVVPQKGNLKYFRIKSLNAVVILPDDRKTGIPPLKIKSGRLLVCDVNNALPMKLVKTSEEGIEWMDEETRKEYVINPSQYYLSPMDVSELHNFLESKITEDILSDNERDIPWWIVAIAVVGIIVIGAVVVTWMITGGNDPTVIIQNITQPQPTPFVPGYMEVK